MSTRIYVGNLPLDVKEREIEDVFYKFGRIRAVDLKTPSRPPAYCFVDFEDVRDAQEAVRSRDGYDFHGHRLRVEQSHGGRSGGGGGGGGGAPPYGGGFRDRDRERDRGRSRDDYGGGGGGGSKGRLGPSPYGPSRRTDFRVIVSGLPLSASWQDLKDHMRKAGEVTFTQVMKDGSRSNMGLVDYASYDDMQTAIRKLDDTEFRNPFDTCTIRVKEDKDHAGYRGGGGGGGRSRSRSRSRDRRRSRSRSRSRSKSRSRSRSRGRSVSRSRSRSPVRSKSPARGGPRSRSRSKSRDRSASPRRSPAPSQ